MKIDTRLMAAIMSAINMYLETENVKPPAPTVPPDSRGKN